MKNDNRKLINSESWFCVIDGHNEVNNFMADRKAAEEKFDSIDVGYIHEIRWDTFEEFGYPKSKERIDTVIRRKGTQVGVFDFLMPSYENCKDENYVEPLHKNIQQPTEEHIVQQENENEEKKEDENENEDNGQDENARKIEQSNATGTSSENKNREDKTNAMLIVLAILSLEFLAFATLGVFCIK